MKPPSFLGSLALWGLLVLCGCGLGVIIRQARSQSTLEAPVSIQPKAGESPTAQIDLMPGGACKTLAAQPAETLGMYRLCAQNRVLWVDFGLGYQRGIPALPLAKVGIICTKASMSGRGFGGSDCSLMQQ